MTSTPETPAPRDARPRLLVTRPAARQEPFAGRARALGFETLAFPCVEIVPLPAFAPPPLPTLASYDAVLFVSRHAVEALVARGSPPWPGVRTLAIGEATGAALERAGQPLARAPVPPYTSEALIDALEREPPLGRLLVVRGRGGRRVLEARQRERGTRVETLEVYERRRPEPDERARRHALIERPPAILSVTSDEILDNLVALAGDALPALRPLPLVVNSERGAALARRRGFAGPLTVARPAGDEGQLAALGRWLVRRRDGAAPATAPDR